MKEFKRAFKKPTTEASLFAAHTEVRRLTAEARQNNELSKLGAIGTAALATIAGLLFALNLVPAAGVAVVATIGAGLVTMKKKMRALVAEMTVRKTKAVLFPEKNNASKPKPAARRIPKASTPSPR